jgi:hypothetical protein
MNSKAIAYDLGVAGIAITLWLAPWDIARAIGYASSVAFSGRAYLTGISLISKERRNDEKEAITYEAEVDFYEQLVGNHVDAELQVKSLEIENRLLQRLSPLLAMKHQLDKQLASCIGNQLDRDIDAVPTEEKALDGASEPEEKPEQFRERFPENLDATSWKAILKALGNGATRKEIIADVLSCPSAEEKLGGQYLDYLKGKYMDI